MNIATHVKATLKSIGSRIRLTVLAVLLATSSFGAVGTYLASTAHAQSAECVYWDEYGNCYAEYGVGDDGVPWYADACGSWVWIGYWANVTYVCY